jgi:hypothetical protein
MMSHGQSGSLFGWVRGGWSALLSFTMAVVARVAPGKTTWLVMLYVRSLYPRKPYISLTPLPRRPNPLAQVMCEELLCSTYTTTCRSLVLFSCSLLTLHSEALQQQCSGVECKLSRSGTLKKPVSSRPSANWQHSSSSQCKWRQITIMKSQVVPDHIDR